MPTAPLTRATMLSSHAASPPSSTVIDVAAVLRALGDPTRLAIAALLARESDALCVCHVEARFDLSQPTISHHLRVLREVALVTTEKSGTWVYYALDRHRLRQMPGLTELLGSVAPFSRKRVKPCCP